VCSSDLDLTPGEQEEVLALRNDEANRVREKSRARRDRADREATAPGSTGLQPTGQPPGDPVYGW